MRYRLEPYGDEENRPRWDRHGRKGQLCLVLARGTMNSCLVKFEDGYAMVTSRNALKLATGDLFQLAAVPSASKNFPEGKDAWP
jgi:hypothetical protein